MGSVGVVPEIPEIRAHAERLTDAYGGSELAAFRPLSFTVLKTFDPPPDAAVGRPLDAAALAALLAGHSMRLHGFLRRQRIVSGVGRRLANEICHRARLSPFAQTSKLGPDDAAALVEAIDAVVAEGLEYDRTRDEMSKSAERPSAVHGHAGEPCPRDGDEIRSVEYRRYRVDYCPTCQTDGKVLADNTTSKFLK